MNHLNDDGEPIRLSDEAFLRRLNDELQGLSQWIKTTPGNQHAIVTVYDGASNTSLSLSSAAPDEVTLMRRLGGQHIKLPLEDFIRSPEAQQLSTGHKIKVSKYAIVETNPRTSTTSGWQSYCACERELSTQQSADIEDVERARQLSHRLFDILHPIWCEYVDDKQPCLWETAQSCDCLTFFCQWLVYVAPERCAEFFLREGAALEAAKAREEEAQNPHRERRRRRGHAEARVERDRTESAEQIKQRIENEFATNPMYVDDDGFLIGFAEDEGNPQALLKRFRKRSLSRLDPANM